jgi:hypothetical protein
LSIDVSFGPGHSLTFGFSKLAVAAESDTLNGEMAQIGAANSLFVTLPD